MADDLSKARERRQRRSTAPVGNFTPSAGRQIPVNIAMAKVRTAELRNSSAPTPERITMALDMRDLYGPEVDEALGGQEPMVDEWETGERIPTKEQVQALAWLTGFPVTFFYLLPPPNLGPVFVCGDNGCQTLGSEDTRTGVSAEGDGQ